MGRRRICRPIDRMAGPLLSMDAGDCQTQRITGISYSSPTLGRGTHVWLDRPLSPHEMCRSKDMCCQQLLSCKLRRAHRSNASRELRKVEPTGCHERPNFHAASVTSTEVGCQLTKVETSGCSCEVSLSAGIAKNTARHFSDSSVMPFRQEVATTHWWLALRAKNGRDRQAIHRLLTLLQH